MIKKHIIRSCLMPLAIAALATTACSDDPVDPLIEEEPPPPPNADPLLGCNGVCHGDPYSTAPPMDLDNNIATTYAGVGAHRSHLKVAPLWHGQIQCSDCHVVPNAVEDPTHIDGDNTAEVTFSPRATNNGQVNATWNGTTCTSYCHGANLPGGANNNPVWTEVNNNGQRECGSCHGTPPPGTHPQEVDCGTCHPTVQPGIADPVNAVFLDPNSHINGTIETQIEGDPPCDSCHGGDGISNPPRDLAGNTTPQYPGVGAHVAHNQPTDWHRPVTCSQCHKVPVNVDDPDHRDGDGQAEIGFDVLNPDGTYDFDNYTCSNLYCHGNGSYELGEKVWNQYEGGLECGDCHRMDGEGMSGQHEDHYDRGVDCYQCHNNVVGQLVGGERAFVDYNLHINGLHDVSFYLEPETSKWDEPTKSCTVAQACHPNTRKWLKGQQNQQN